MTKHIHLAKNELANLIRKGAVKLAGNLRLKIYGTLQCRSGKRMKKVNRIFFINQHEADHAGFRPCAHCMPREFQHWKGQQEMG